MAGTLDHSPADVLRRLLIALGYGSDPSPTDTTTATWPIYAGGEPDDPNRTPDSRITILNTTGKIQQREMAAGTRASQEGVQIAVRAARASAGWAKADAIANALDQISHRSVTIGSSHYDVWAVTRGNVIDAGKGPNSSVRLLTINATTCINQTDS